MLYKTYNFEAEVGDEIYNDVYTVPEVDESQTEYEFVTAAYTGSEQACGGPYRHQFYMVVSFNDGTDIRVEQQDGSVTTGVLGAFGTYVQTAIIFENQIGSGTKITSTQPITVVSGNLCVVTGVYADSFVSSITSSSSLSTQYIVPALAYLQDLPQTFYIEVTSCLCLN